MESKTQYHDDAQALEPTTSAKIEMPTIKPGELIIARLSRIDPTGQAYVVLSGFLTQAIPAQTTVNLSPSDSGRQVAVMFINSDISQPIITGLVLSPLYSILESSLQSNNGLDYDTPAFESHTSHPLGKDEELCVDGKKVRIEGSEEIVLKCGDSSITLTKSGKILIRGKYLLNRSSGVNRIMGGSVQVN